MTMAQLAALIDAENAINAPGESRPTERGTTSDLLALARVGVG